MKRFFLVAVLGLASAFIALPSFAHDGNGHPQDATLASAVMNGVDNQENRQALKKFVDHAKHHVEAAEHIEDLLILLSEFRNSPDWIAHESSIYLYIFTAGEEEGHHEEEGDHSEGEDEDDGHIEEIAVFNANNPAIEGLNIHEMTDANGVEIAHELLEAATEGDGFGEYTWDDPRIEGDEVDEEGKSPGNSDKVGYAVTVQLLGGEKSELDFFVLGSGFYPTPLMNDSDDGCAVAGGTTERNGLSLLFNLFLMVSALFLVVSWRTPAVRR